MYQEREAYMEGRASASEVVAGGWMGRWGCWRGGMAGPGRANVPPWDILPLFGLRRARVICFVISDV